MVFNGGPLGAGRKRISSWRSNDKLLGWRQEHGMVLILTEWVVSSPLCRAFLPRIQLEETVFTLIWVIDHEVQMK